MLRSLFRRPPSVRVPIQNGTVDLQRVAITRRTSSSPVLYRVFTTVAVTYFVASTINYVYPDSAHSSERSTGTVKNGAGPYDHTKVWRENWDKAEATVSQNEPAVIHLMLPIWIRKQEPEPWKADDPTWKSFQALADDKKRLKDITATIKKSLMKAVLIKYGRTLMELSSEQLNGERKVTYHESWRLAPPLYAPATYEVPCVFVEPDKTSYGWRQVPPSVGEKMDRVFHPIGLAKAFYHGVEEFVWASYLITRARLVDQINSLTGTERPPSIPQAALSEDEKALKRLAIGRVPEDTKESFLPFLRGEYGEHESRRAYRNLVKTMTYQGAIESACAVFQAHWIQGQERSMQAHSRNSVILRGNIAFVGDRGTLFMHAVAVYSPETNSLVGQPIIKDLYLSPNMEKWVQRETPEVAVEGATSQDEEKQQKKGEAGDAWEQPSQREDTSRTEKPPTDENQEEDREK
ncbi:hypothetical protein G647_02738 [Cladophialophora carrionii CBS 160.54]|uniref:Uncharacterized protein n=1 Tax=Cladophialophora carrionii CBS 160.54 TaxID=1279043 RepID=V9DH17_9EURO|nr:uncharacterized protein G647_02738 [Cladophialophora carrionii CBS 160.54]ETI25961.1 hypothetical protein G647_02738 [Cladophialophora carrionii CBS 160.54]